MFSAVGLALNENGTVPFESFCNLYRMQNIQELRRDLAALGIDRVAPAAKDNRGTGSIPSSLGTSSSVSADLAVVLSEAKRRGISVRQWFRHFDPEKSCRVSHCRL